MGLITMMYLCAATTLAGIKVLNHIINAAILLWTFDFSEPAGAEGVVTADPAGVLDSGLVLYVQLCSDFPEL